MGNTEKDQDAESALDELIADYDAARKVHVPKWPGGMNKKIAAELIQLGWRKRK